MLFHNTVDQFFIPVIEVGVAPLLRAFFSLFSLFFILLKHSMFVYSILNLNQWGFFLALVKVGLPRQSCYISFKFAPTAA